MDIHTFLETLHLNTGKTPKKSGSSYSSCCPAHDDENPSLSIREASDGKILLHCFAGCPVASICNALGLVMSDLFDSDFSPKNASARTVYSYTDEEGRELYRKIRIEPGYDGKTKSFFSERTDEKGQTIKNLNGCRKVPYRLPEVLKGIADKTPIFLVEGEKDADKLATYDLVATTSSESLKWPQEFTDMLKEADVVLLYDMDKTGLERKNMLCAALHGKTKRFRVIDLPGIEYQESHGGDISDWLKIGHTTPELTEIVANTPDYEVSSHKSKIRVVTLGEFLQMELPKREMLLSPFLTTQCLCLLYAKRGVGKTHVALGIAYAVAIGGRFLQWEAPKPRRVLYIDGEMPAAPMQERLNRLYLSEEADPNTRDFLRLITPDLQEGAMPDLSTREGRMSIQHAVEECDLIIVDNLSCLFRSGTENDAESWLPAQEWGLELRRQGKSILFVHHAGKGGQQRGTSKKEDILDAVICLKQPAGYRPEEGARFEVQFEKTRHFAGKDATSFEVRLHEQEDGLWLWEISDTKVDPNVIQVAELSKQGRTIREIIEATGLTKSQVTTRQKTARDLGLLDK